LVGQKHKGYKSAKILKENDCGNDIVAFHCQQAIEKVLKGYILCKNNEVIEGHSLIFLCKEASKINKVFRNYLKDCALINQYYIETRYPADVPLVVTDDEAEECIKITEDIYHMVLSNI
jgi:HEPN domain-containing protein